MPGDWVKVTPAFRIIDAEYSIPRAAGDQFDGRVTIMAAGGDVESMSGIWSSEFARTTGDGPRVDSLKIGGIEAKTVDIRGTWVGSSSNRVEPREEYRLYAVIIPFSASSSYFVKITGPRETISRREDEIKSFVKSANIDSSIKRR